jgi:hypothetical protein
MSNNVLNKIETESKYDEFEYVKQKWPSIESIGKPRMIGLLLGNGVGSKLLQSHLDGSQEIYMIPAYPLMYFYPHWQDWKKQYHNEWNWNKIIDVFCEKHASVIDSRLIPGFNGLRNLGKEKNEYISINEKLFRFTLAHLLKNQPITSKLFIIAIHYAYAICKGEDINKKHVIIYHLHAHQYLKFLLADFPELKVIIMTRDPRSNIQRRIDTCYKVDASKLNMSDTYLFRALPVYNTVRYILQDNQIITATVGFKSVKVVRHEDLGLRLEETLKKICLWIEINYNSKMLEVTFGGKEWWGDDVYNMEKTNKFNSRVLSKDWQKTKSNIEWYMEEGIMYDFLLKYKYEIEKYKKDSKLNRIKLLLLIILPSKNEIKLCLFYMNLNNIFKFMNSVWLEAIGVKQLKDYSWNATYLYKWMYIELQLWKPRIHIRITEVIKRHALQYNIKIIKLILINLAISLYILGQFIRYIYAFLRLPYWYIRTRKIIILRLLESWSGRAEIPECLVKIN